MMLALTGEPVDAEEAHRLGLVDRLVPHGHALASAQALARTIAANAPLSVVAAKATILASYDLTLDEAFTRQSTVEAVIAASDDAREGATAFAERREPQWSGR